MAPRDYERLTPASPSGVTDHPPAFEHRKPQNLILFLAADPGGTSQIALDQECAAIERELRMTSNRDDFEFVSKWAVSVDDMARHLMLLQPAVLHFSGHGARGERMLSRSSTASRDAIGTDARSSGHGICLQDEYGGSHVVTALALAMMISSAAAASPRVLVLNACYSDAQANELLTAVDCVVGMTGAIREAAARSFAVGFYRALGNRRSVGNALEHAVATLAAKQLPDAELPRCRTRNGVDANQVMLTASD